MPIVVSSDMREPGASCSTSRYSILLAVCGGLQNMYRLCTETPRRFCSVCCRRSAAADSHDTRRGWCEGASTTGATCSRHDRTAPAERQAPTCGWSCGAAVAAATATPVCGAATAAEKLEAASSTVGAERDPAIGPLRVCLFPLPLYGRQWRCRRSWRCAFLAAGTQAGECLGLGTQLMQSAALRKKAPSDADFRTANGCHV